MGSNQRLKTNIGIATSPLGTHH